MVREAKVDTVQLQQKEKCRGRNSWKAIEKESAESHREQGDDRSIGVDGVSAGGFRRLGVVSMFPSSFLLSLPPMLPF